VDLHGGAVLCEAVEGQAGGFAHPDAGGEEEVQEGVVAECEEGGGDVAVGLSGGDLLVAPPGLLKELPDLLLAKGSRKLLDSPEGELDPPERGLVEEPLPQPVVAEDPEGDHRAHGHLVPRLDDA
jgi:hypothetical protein